MSDDRRDADRENMVSLRHYVETLFREYKEAHAREHDLIAEGVERTRMAMDKRLDAMNELRAQILEERGGLATKEWVNARVDELRGALAAHKTASQITSDDAAKARTLASRTTVGLVVSSVISIGLALLAVFT